MCVEVKNWRKNDGLLAVAAVGAGRLQIERKGSVLELEK